MDVQSLINIGATAIMGVVGWFVRGVMAEQKDAKTALEMTQAQLTALRLKVAEDYVTHKALDDIKATLSRFEDEIKSSLVRIEGKLDQKADK